jgi:hypothetical protein
MPKRHVGCSDKADDSAPEIEHSKAIVVENKMKSMTPVTRAFELHIEELVLHGFDPNDRFLLADAVERGLTNLLADGNVTLTNEINLPVLESREFSVKPFARADEIGRQIAQALFGGLTGLATGRSGPGQDRDARREHSEAPALNPSDMARRGPFK